MAAIRAAAVPRCERWDRRLEGFLGKSPVVLGNGQPASRLQRRTPKILRRRVSCRCGTAGAGRLPELVLGKFSSPA